MTSAGESLYSCRALLASQDSGNFAAASPAKDPANRRSSSFDGWLSSPAGAKLPSTSSKSPSASQAGDRCPPSLP